MGIHKRTGRLNKLQKDNCLSEESIQDKEKGKF